MRAILGALVVVAVGPVGVAMAESAPAIVSPANGSSTLNPTPAFSGTTNGTENPVTLKVYAGTSATGTPVEEPSVLPGVPVAGEWSLTLMSLLGEGPYTAVATEENAEQTETNESNPVTFTVDAAPVVTENPAAMTVRAGEPARFTATASGTPTPEVQWEVSTDGGTTFSSDTTDTGNSTDTLTLAATTVAENGNEYRAVFTNTPGTEPTTATSTPATLTVDAAPVVTSNPASQGVKVGEAATFTAAASGTPAPSVQWQESTDFGSTWTDDTTDSGNTTGTLTVLPTTVAESGHEYRAVFTNVVETVPSEPATLTVFAKPVVPVAPVITSDPVDQTVLAGEGAAFTAAASGVPAPEVRWQVSTDSGRTWANDTTDAGNTTGTLAVLQATVAESGHEYRAVFTNAADTATSKAATLTVDSPPSTPPATGTTTTPATSPLSPTPSVAPATPPAASFQWFPSAPHTGESISLVSTSTDAASPIAGFAWSLTGNGAFNTGAPAITASFAAPGDHVVQLRVTGANGLTSVATETIPVTSPVLTLMQPFPVVRIAGSESSSGARISLLTVEAPVGTQVEITCRGRHCPSRSQSRVVVASRGPSKTGTVVLTFGRFERSLQAGVVLEIRVSKQGEIGKYTSFAIRRGRLPVRVDACVEPADPKPIPCPAS